MDISKHIGKVRDGIDGALSLADDATKDVASRVASVAEPSLRLALIDAVTEAAAEINDGLYASRVTVAMDGLDPTFVVQQTQPEPDGEHVDFELIDEDDTQGDVLEDEEADETLVRFSLRLPKWAKDKVDDRAERRGMSTNAYLTEVIIGEIAGGWPKGGPERSGPPFGPGPRRGPGRGGWGPGGWIDADTANSIASVLSEVFGGQDPRRPGGPGARRGGPHRDGRGPRRDGPGVHRDGRGPRRDGCGPRGRDETDDE
ncbi:MAG: hypothetical protein ACK5MR_07080 [Cumulibacter sp.]